MKRLIRFALGLAAALLLVPVSGQAQSWPAKPVRLVIPFPPGSALDLLGRQVGAKVGESVGQPVVVENRVGANGMIGSEFVARAAPDGYTILFGTSGTHVTSVHLSKNLSYDPVKDFTPITAAVEPATCVAVHASVPANTLPELIDLARRNPGKLTYATSGIGSVFHMTGELFKQTTGVDMVHVPFKGVAQAMVEFVSGRVPVSFSSVADTAPHAKSGKVRILAGLEARRYAGMPEVPTVAETVPAFRKPATWFGFLGPAGLAPAVVTRLHDEIAKSLNAPEVRKRLDDGGLAVIASSPDQFAAMIRTGIEEFGRIAKAAGIRPE